MFQWYYVKWLISLHLILWSCTASTWNFFCLEFCSGTMLSDACYLGCLLTCLILFGINDFELYKLDMCQDYELWMFLNFSNNQIRIPTTSVKKLSKILKWVDDNTTLRQRLVCKKIWPLADLLANLFWPKYFGWCLVPKLVCDRVGGGWVILSAWVGRLQ